MMAIVSVGECKSSWNEDLRIVEGIDGFLDTLCTGSQRPVWQLA